MRQHEWFIIDKDQNIIATCNAFCRKIVHRPDGNSYCCLEHVDGILNNNIYFNYDQEIQMSECYSDPNTNPGKIKEGCEEQFDFFMKNGYHKPASGE